MSALDLALPYLVFLGDVRSPLDAKTGRGLVDWCPDRCLGQLRYPGCTQDLNLPDMTLMEAKARGAGSLVVGVASFGGRLEKAWIDTFADALEAGLDVVSGMHSYLNGNTRLGRIAAEAGRRLIDLRQPPRDTPVASGRRRRGLRLLTVGTDCAVGKKYTAMAIHRELELRQRPATFRATGQTGILISGGGIPMDAVVSDFLAGAAEMLTPDNEPGHWDVIEGQGSLFHPAYAAVTLGLLHGSQPDAIVLCHDTTRTCIDGYPGYSISSLGDCIERYLEAGRLTNAGIRCVGLSLNSAGMSSRAREQYFESIRKQVGQPVVDPLVSGVAPLVDALLESMP